MTMFLWNLSLAIAWAFATGQLTVSNILIGLFLGFGVLYFTQLSGERDPYFLRVMRAIRFIVFYLVQLVRSNIRVALDVATPRHRMRPGVIAVPLDVETNVEITMLANLITLTPGSVSLDLSPDRKVLYVHVMYIDRDVEHARAEIKEGLEQRVLELLR